MAFGLIVFIKRIVNDEIETRREVGHIAAESLIGIDRNLQAIQVYTIVWLKEFLHIGVFIPLHLFRREALPAEVLKGLVPYGVHRLRSMIKDDLPRLLIEIDVLLL